MGKRMNYICLGVCLMLSICMSGCSKKKADQMKETDQLQTEDMTETTQAGEVSTKPVDKSKLSGYYNLVKNYNTSEYANPEVLDEPMKAAEVLLADENASEEDVNQALANLKEAVSMLGDGSGFTAVEHLEVISDLPDPYVFLDKSQVETPEDWEKRAEEIKKLYEYYMYGVYRDGKDETVSYQVMSNQMKITVAREGKETSFNVSVHLPDAKKVPMPEGGWPVIVCFHPIMPEQYAVDNGYAIVTLNTYEIASDDANHKGCFYDLYPYGDTWEEQTGVLLAWSWGASKVLDALEAGANAELQINAKNSIITGVSRWGKAAAVCGAFEKRFKMVAPSCSGAGGLAIYRYKSEGKTYDFSSKGASNAYTYTQNEPLSSLQSSAEKGWFNDTFTEFGTTVQLPVDQYMLASLCADKDRYLFIIASCISEDWVNAPSMWLCYKATNSIYQFLGLEDHIVANIHKEGHAVIQEDMEYMIDYFNYHVYGIEPERDLSVLKTSVFEEEANFDTIFDDFNQTWIR